MTNQEEWYRKWIGICQITKLPKLVMTFDDGIKISSGDKVLLEMSRTDYANTDANEIAKQLQENVK